jgi:hypothetical protein
MKASSPHTTESNNLKVLHQIKLKLFQELQIPHHNSQLKRPKLILDVNARGWGWVVTGGPQPLSKPRQANQRDKPQETEKEQEGRDSYGVSPKLLVLM